MSPFSKKVVFFADLGSLLGTILEALGQLLHKIKTIETGLVLEDFWGGGVPLPSHAVSAGSARLLGFGGSAPIN